MKTAPQIQDVRAAAERIAPYVHRTPVLTCSALDEMTGAHLFFKCENFQRVGAFKMRGATNTVFSLTEDEVARGVATHSSGNHAAALALAARLRGTKATVVMPDNSPRVKLDAVAGYGAEIILCPPTLQARESHLKEVQERTGATFVPPYDDPRIIAGQGTASLELLDEVSDLDLMIAPIGGGGLLSGTAITFSSLSSKTTVVGVEPEVANDAQISLRGGTLVPSNNPKTVADGLRTSLSELTFSVIREHVEDVWTADEEEILSAMRLIWERMKIVVEPSAAVALATLQTQKEQIRGKRIGIILSGGNVDLSALSQHFPSPAQTH